MNDAEALIQEMFLANASPEKVYEWLEKHVRPGLFGDVPESIFRTLHKRNEPLVKLALARYCDAPEIVRELFKSGDETMRCATLSNRVVLSGFLREDLLGGPRTDQILDKTELFELFTSGSKNELQALLTNPELPSSLLTATFERSGVAAGMSDERWSWAVAWALTNPKLEKKPSTRDFPDDGWGYFQAQKPFEATWALLERAPVEEGWAEVLARYLRYVPYEHPPKAEVNFLQRAITRWKRDKEKDEYDPFAELRTAIAFLVTYSALTALAESLLPERTTGWKEIVDMLKNKAHDDPAVGEGYAIALDKLRIANQEVIQAYFDKPENRLLDKIIEVHSLIMVFSYVAFGVAGYAALAAWMQSVTTFIIGAIILIGFAALWRNRERKEWLLASIRPRSQISDRKVQQSIPMLRLLKERGELNELLLSHEIKRLIS